MFLLIIGYYLFILGVFLTMSHTKIAVLNKKYTLGILSLGLFLIAIFFCTKKEYSIILTSLLLAGLFLYYFIKGLKTKEKIEFIEIPENKYDISSLEEAGTPVIIKYILTYNNKIYQLSTIPPKNKPEITLVIKGNNNVADIIVKNNKVTLNSVISTFRDICSLIAAIALPFTVLTKSENLFSTAIIFIVSALTWKVTDTGKSVYQKIIHYFSIGLFIFALLILISFI